MNKKIFALSVTMLRTRIRRKLFNPGSKVARGQL